ncbi:MAG: hypothetical protein ACTS4U_00995 [Candidatus Hodgkinia cicadicola]
MKRRNSETRRKTERKEETEGEEAARKEATKEKKAKAREREKRERRVPGLPPRLTALAYEGFLPFLPFGGNILLLFGNISVLSTFRSNEIIISYSSEHAKFALIPRTEVTFTWTRKYAKCAWINLTGTSLAKRNTTPSGPAKQVTHRSLRSLQTVLAAQNKLKAALLRRASDAPSSISVKLPMNPFNVATSFSGSGDLRPPCLKTPTIRGLASGGRTITLGPKVRPRRLNMSKGES